MNAHSAIASVGTGWTLKVILFVLQEIKDTQLLLR